MVSCRMCLQSVVMNVIILIWSLLLDGYFIHENRGIKGGLVYCELEGWILPAYSFLTSIGIILVCIQLILLILCCGCLKDEECLRVRSYTIDLHWAILKEIPQIMIIFHLNLCRDGWFKMSSLFKAIFSIFVTIWKLYNLWTFLRQDFKSSHIPEWCRSKRLYLCFPIFLVPVWLLNLALSITIAIFFIHRSRGPETISIPGSIQPLFIQDKYLYHKYLVHSGIYLSWPDENHFSSYIKLSEIDYIMANKKSTVHLLFQLPYVCFERSLTDRKPNRCFHWNNQTNLFQHVSINEIPWNSHQLQNISFTFRYRPPSNQYNLGQIVYESVFSRGSLFFNRLLYFRLHHSHSSHFDDDFLDRTMNGSYQFYIPNQQLIGIDKAWRHGVGKCRPCVLGPQSIKH